MTTKQTQIPELMPVADAAAYLAVGVRTLTRWSAIGRAPAPIKLTPGRRGAVRYRRSDLERWVADGCPDLRDTEGEA